jgi:hypothetical protein
VCRRAFDHISSAHCIAPRLTGRTRQLTAQRLTRDWGLSLFLAGTPVSKAPTVLDLTLTQRSSMHRHVPLQGAGMIFLTKPFGLCGERLSSAPTINLFGLSIKADNSIAGDAPSRIPLLLWRWFFT